MPKPGYTGNYSRFGFNLKLTPAVKWLLIANTGVWLVELIVGRFEGGLDFIYNHLACSFEQVFYSGEVWQPLSCMFLHDPMGISHILWNMLILWMFGSPLESFWRTKNFLWYYFITGLGSSAVILLVAFFVTEKQTIPTLGASGALSGLLVAFGFLFPNNQIYFFGIFPIKAKYLVMGFVGLSLLQALTLGSSNVSVEAHLGGLFTGFLLVTGFWKPKKVWSWVRLLWLKRRYHRLKGQMRVVDRDDQGGGGMYH